MSASVIAAAPGAVDKAALEHDVAQTLDLTGYRCPIPVIRAEAALRRLKPGEQITIVADDPIAIVDLPHFCGEAGHQVERLPAEAPLCVFLVTRGENR